MRQGHLMPKSPSSNLNTATHTNISTQYRHYTMLTYLAVSYPSPGLPVPGFDIIMLMVVRRCQVS